MKEPREDDERLSALIEGQVAGRERDEMLARLAASTDDYEVFTDTAAVLQALHDEDALASATAETPVISLSDDNREQKRPVREMENATATEVDGVIPLRTPVRGRRLPARWLALAASVAGVALISTLALQRRGSQAHEPVRLAARIDSISPGLPVGWASPTQSGGRGTAEIADDTALAVYAGALLVDISVAANAGDTAQTKELADRLSRRTEQDASATAPLQHIFANPDAPDDSLRVLVERATDRLAELGLGRKPLELGAWIEAARLAAHKRDNGFFARSATDGMLGRAERMAGDNADAHTAVDNIRGALPTGRAPEWNSLQKGLDALLTELTR